MFSLNKNIKTEKIDGIVESIAIDAAGDFGFDIAHYTTRAFGSAFIAPPFFNDIEKVEKDQIFENTLEKEI